MNKSAQWRRLVVAFFIFCIVYFSVAQTQSPASSKRLTSKSPPPAPGVLPVPLVAEGDPGTAKAYYLLLANELGFANPNTFGDNHTIQDLLTFCGYEKLLAADIEKLSSDVLMDFGQLKSQVSNASDFTAYFGTNPRVDDPIRKLVSSRYFTPKITDVSDPANPPGPNRLYGWRRVVRLLPRTGSPALAKDITELYLLFNHFSKLTADPFATRSVNNQAMLIRKKAVSPDRPVYWLVYEPLNDPMKPGRVKHYLDASFDASQPSTGPAPSIRKYYVPDACANCHGSEAGNPGFKFPTAKLNYLDSDHWFDRIQNRDDFPEMQYASYGVLYDGDTDLRKPQFEKAFQTLRLLNAAIEAQNQVVELPAQPSFQLPAVQKWIQVHQTDSRPVPLVNRALNRGDRVWDVSNPNDVRLLAKLNQYCFRCHSSLYYSVFDKEQVYQFAKFGLLKDVIDSNYMPQDRLLSDSSKAELFELIDKLAAER